MNTVPALNTTQVTNSDDDLSQSRYYCKYSNCDKSYTRKHRLQFHVQTKHLKLIKEIGCPECHMNFTEKGNLKIHMRIHTGEKPYQCSYCPKRFSTGGNKIDHERRHLDLKPFGCVYCGEKFFRNQSLQTHNKRCNAQLMHSQDFTQQEKLQNFDNSNIMLFDNGHMVSTQIPTSEISNHYMQYQNYSHLIPKQEAYKSNSIHSEEELKSKGQGQKHHELQSDQLDKFRNFDNISVSNNIYQPNPIDVISSSQHFQNNNNSTMIKYGPQPSLVNLTDFQQNDTNKEKPQIKHIADSQFSRGFQKFIFAQKENEIQCQLNNGISSNKEIYSANMGFNNITHSKATPQDDINTYLYRLIVNKYNGCDV